MSDIFREYIGDCFVAIVISIEPGNTVCVKPHRKWRNTDRFADRVGENGRSMFQPENVWLNNRLLVEEGEVLMCQVARTGSTCSVGQAVQVLYNVGLQRWEVDCGIIIGCRAGFVWDPVMLNCFDSRCERQWHFDASNNRCERFVVDTIETVRELAVQERWDGLLDKETLGIFQILSHFIDRNVYNGTRNVWVEDIEIDCSIPRSFCNPPIKPPDRLDGCGYGWKWVWNEAKCIWDEIYRPMPKCPDGFAWDFQACDCSFNPCHGVLCPPRYWCENGICICDEQLPVCPLGHVHADYEAEFTITAGEQILTWNDPYGMEGWNKQVAEWNAILDNWR
jgi:hypothetical protein